MKKNFLSGLFLGANVALFGMLVMAGTALSPQGEEATVVKEEKVVKKKDTNFYFQGQFIGEVRMFAGNFAPKGWALCDGQLLPISQYNALFSLLGTSYGGNGRTTFALPDMRGRVAIHPGEGPGLSRYALGQKGGNEHIVIHGGNGGASVANSGQAGAGSNMQPYLTVNYIIALEGEYPPRQ